jgi:hypothetical protein
VANCGRNQPRSGSAALKPMSAFEVVSFERNTGMTVFASTKPSPPW